MLYKHYKDIDHVYIVHRTTGFAVTGQCDYEEHEVVFTTDDLGEAKRIGRELFPLDKNHPGWTSPNFTINVNAATTTEKGKKVLADLEKEWKDSSERIKKDQEENPDSWRSTKIGDITFSFKRFFDITPDKDNSSFRDNFGLLVPEGIHPEFIQHNEMKNKE